MTKDELKAIELNVVSAQILSTSYLMGIMHGLSILIAHQTNQDQESVYLEMKDKQQNFRNIVLENYEADINARFDCVDV